MQAKILQRVSHCLNIVHYHEHGCAIDETVFWIIMEELKGHSLEHKLNEIDSEAEILQVAFRLHLS